MGKETEIDSKPYWVEADCINEISFAVWFIAGNNISCSNKKFYGKDGEIPEDTMSKMILEAICPYVKKNVTKQIANLLGVIRLAADIGEIKEDTDRIHFQNGTYYLDGYFSKEMQTTVIRIPIDYDPDAQKPKKWLKFLGELLEPDDILTLQEFMGYCLIPTTKGQKMLMLIGNGGEGKSRIGRVLKAILGGNMNITSIKKLATDRFCKADQERKLLMLDDDMKMDALPDTDVLKSIVTMEDTMDLEEKNKQSFQGKLFVRIMGFGNGSLSALHDRSEGFYRRQIILRTKDKPEGRIDDAMLGEKLIAEKQGILLWMLEGLHRLIANGYHFTESESARETMRECRRLGNNMLEFYESEGYISFEKGTYASTKALYAAYKQWCYDNADKPFAEKTFAAQLGKDANRLSLRHDKNIDIGNGKRARGYRNVCVLVRTDNYMCC